MENYEYGLIFGNEPVSDSEKTRVIDLIKGLGGLTFKVKQDSDGWVATCNEVRSIITGGTNPNPSGSEIEAEIRSAIFAVFNIKVEKTAPADFENFKYEINVPQAA